MTRVPARLRRDRCRRCRSGKIRARGPTSASARRGPRHRERRRRLELPWEGPILGTHDESWPDEDACAQSAARLAARIAARGEGEAFAALVELRGTLGAGKTTFARHLLAALGVAERVKSPTYTLLEPYRAAAERGGFAIAHADFYRLDDPQEWEDAGFRDVFAAPGLKLVEWAERAAGLLPAADLVVRIEPSAGERREVRFEAGSAVGASLLAPA